MKNQFSVGKWANKELASILESQVSNKRKQVAVLAVLTAEFGNFIDLYAKVHGMKTENNDDDD